MCRAPAEDISSLLLTAFKERLGMLCSPLEGGECLAYGWGSHERVQAQQALQCRFDGLESLRKPPF